MSSVSVADYISPGATYTFTFQLSAYGVPVSKSEIQQALMSGVPILSRVDVKESLTGAVGGTIAGGLWDITFSFDGPGNMQISDVAALIKGAVEATHWLVSFDLVTATEGSTGEVTTPADALSSLSGIGTWVLVALSLLVAFQLFSTVKEVA